MLSSEAPYRETATVSSKEPTRHTRRRMLSRAIAGVAFEYYDYTVFATFAPFFAESFFVHGNKVAATLDTLLVFALGFVMRPLGAISAGRLADRFGRKPVMMAALGIGASGSLAIAVTPTFHTIGVAAVIILVVARLSQGLAHGAESISAYVYTAEIADPKRRAFHCSAYPSALILGVIPASLLGVILTTFLSSEAMNTWGWRIPFAIGALYGFFIVVIRRGVKEPETYLQHREQALSEDRGYWRNVWEYRRTVGSLFLLWPAFALAFYTLAVGFTEFAITHLDAEPNDAFWAGLVAQVIYLVALPFWARVSDRRGRRFNYTVALAGLATLAFPLQLMLGPSLWQLLVPMSIGLLVWAAGTSTELAFVNELIPNRVRAQVMSLPSSIGAVVFGGTAPYLRSWAEAHGSTFWFTGYVVVVCLIALVATRRLPETLGRDLARADAPTGLKQDEPRSAWSRPKPVSPRPRVLSR